MAQQVPASEPRAGRPLIALVLLLLLATAVFAADVYVTPNVVLPAAAYALSVLLAAYLLPPRRAAGVAVYALALQILAVAVHPEPFSWESVLSPVATALVGVLAVTLSRRTQREVALREQVQTTNGELRKANERLVLSAVAQREAAEREQALRQELQVQYDELRLANDSLRETERALAESEKRYRTLVELSPDAIIIHSEGKIAFTNAAGAALLGGNRPQDVVGKPVLAFVAPSFRDTVMERIRQIREAGKPAPLIEEEFIRLDGTSVPVEVAATPFVYQGRPAVQVVARDITERKQSERFREEYVSLVSHDLRTPLTTLLGMADWLKQRLEEKGLPQEARSAELVVTSAKRMGGMITDMVESARLEAGRLALRKEPTDLVRLVSELVRRVGTLRDQQRITVEAATPPPAAFVDRERVERAVANLITNALKYSPADAPVVVRVARGDDTAQVSVTDRGVGIPADDLPHLFERNFRARTAGKREGLGLGLYITRLIAEAHGGSVSAESTLGKGSTFYLRLPLL